MSPSAIPRSLTLHLVAAFDWFLPRAHWALLAGLLLVGLSVVGDYGQSWDELGIYGYGAHSLRAYRDFGNAPPLTEYDAYLDRYGPAYFALASLVSGFLTRASPALSTTQVWHMLNFLTFTLAAGVLHALCRRWLSAPASFGAAALFAAQPLLWGHAFINPKDIPFMALFSLSVVAGFSMVDRVSSGRKTLLATSAAAALLGVTTSVRAAGPWAGILVSVYAALTLRRCCLRWLLLYAVLATLASFLTWPFLWAAPLDRLSQTVAFMSSFPFAPKVQFMGGFYLGSELPWFYVPALFGVQLTEPALALVVVGLPLALWKAFRRGADQSRSRAILLLFVGWTMLPILLLLVLGSTLYDNARQLFFVLPPLFVLSGLALDALLSLTRGRVWTSVLLAILMVPGALAARGLHPYEYVYYNSLVGGTGGAYGGFEMDYWGTSFTSVRDWLNRKAPTGSRLWIGGAPAYLVAEGLRPDITVACSSQAGCDTDIDYYVALVRWKAETGCRGAQTAHEIGREGAVFAVVKQVPEGRRCR
jgi:hypothetical protein